MGAVVIEYSAKALKQKLGLRENARAQLDLLEEDLRETAGKPYGRGWKSVGPLSELGGKMHCHLKRDVVVIWDIEESRLMGATKTTVVIDYVGKRDNAYKNKK